MGSFCLFISVLFVSSLLSKGSEDQNDTDVAFTEGTDSVDFTAKATTTDIATFENSTLLADQESPLSEVQSKANDEDVESNPIFKAIKDFLLHARSTLIESPLDSQLDARTERILNALEVGFKEVTTAIQEEIHTTSVSPFEEQSSTTINSTDAFNQNDTSERMGSVLQMPTRRMSSMNVAANLSTSCSTCYESLDSCVRSCFVEHNCKKVERNARRCPAVPTRLCNPFTPWSPIDQCRINEDCESPLLCCNDGCVNRCSLGVWKSNFRR